MKFTPSLLLSLSPALPPPMCEEGTSGVYIQREEGVEVTGPSVKHVSKYLYSQHPLIPFFLFFPLSRPSQLKEKKLSSTSSSTAEPTMGITIQGGPDRISTWGTPVEIIRVVFAVARPLLCCSGPRASSAFFHGWAGFSCP